MSQLSRTLLFKRTNFASFCFLIYGTSPASFTLIVVFPNHWFEGRIIVDELLSKIMHLPRVRIRTYDLLMKSLLQKSLVY